jgi:hypothetical protein
LTTDYFEDALASRGSRMRLSKSRPGPEARTRDTWWR